MATSWHYYFLLISLVFLVSSNFFLLSESVQYGHCDCKCAHPDCNFPKTKEECAKCASQGAVSSSFDEGKCSIYVGKRSAIDCGLVCTRNFKGCRGYSGSTHYNYGNYCYCGYNKP